MLVCAILAEDYVQQILFIFELWMRRLFELITFVSTFGSATEIVSEI